MLYELFSRARKEGLMALESDSDNPDQSPVFSKYPIFLKDHHVRNFVCDTIRTAAAGIEPFDVDQMMELDMDVHHHEQTVPVSALSTMAIPCPALESSPPFSAWSSLWALSAGHPKRSENKFAAALVGTFLGILLRCGFVG